MSAADWVTASRFVFAAGILWAVPFSPAFWLCYFCAGLSDMLDGPLARALHKVSRFGARLDSVADIAFFIAAAVALLRVIKLPLFIWCGCLLVFCVRMAALAIGLHKYHTLPFLHTYANKAAGALLFAFPLFAYLFTPTAAASLTLFVAAAASVEELAIILVSPHLDPDRIGWLEKKKEPQ